MNLCVNLDSAIFRDHFVRNWYPLMDWNSLLHNRIVLHAVLLLDADSMKVVCQQNLLAHAEHAVDLGDAKPVQYIRHEGLKSHIFDTSNVLSPGEVFACLV